VPISPGDIFTVQGGAGPGAINSVFYLSNDTMGIHTIIQDLLKLAITEFRIVQMIKTLHNFVVIEEQSVTFITSKIVIFLLSRDFGSFSRH
jgi:hypothetical protein